MLSHPFMDPRILSLALGVRLRCRPDADEQKPLLTRAMRDVLPDQIRRRRGKVNFNELYYRGLARNLPALEDLIRTSRIGEFDVIDRNILLDCLRQTALGCETSASRGASLNLTLSLLTWLSIREKTPPCQETSGETMRFPLQLSQTEELVI